VLALSVDPQGSAVWWASRLHDLPFNIAQAHDDIEGLKKIKDLPGIEHVYGRHPGMDRPGGWTTTTPTRWERGRPRCGCGPCWTWPIKSSCRSRTEPLSFDPTARTITKVLQRGGLRYIVVIHNWDPRDGLYDLNQTKDFVKANGWPLANTVIRHYKVHARASADGLVVTEYPVNRVALQARETSISSRSNSTSGEATDGTRTTNQSRRPGRRRRRQVTGGACGRQGPTRARAVSAALRDLTPNPRNPATISAISRTGVDRRHAAAAGGRGDREGLSAAVSRGCDRHPVRGN